MAPGLGALYVVETAGTAEGSDVAGTAEGSDVAPAGEFSDALGPVNASLT